jgi:ketosteroid isomerase-like protein
MVDEQHVRHLFELLEARGWDDLRPLLAEDLLYEVPQTRERVRGREQYIRFCIEFPAEWHLAVDRVVADDATRQAAVWVKALSDGVPADNLAFLTFDEAGRLAHVADFWPEAYEPPPGRPDVVERT